MKKHRSVLELNTVVKWAGDGESLVGVEDRLS